MGEELNDLISKYGSDRVVAMARGVIVLDENLQQLKAALESMNIKVIVPKAGTSDDDIKSTLLPHRIFITKNTKDFIADASVFEYGIIALEHIDFIDKSRDQTNQTAAKLISKAIQDFSLWSKGHGFLLALKPSGVHEITNLVS